MKKKQKKNEIITMLAEKNLTVYQNVLTAYNFIGNMAC